MVWIIFALIMGVGIGAILWPLSRARHAPSPTSTPLDFYKSEIERVRLDLERGFLTPDNAIALEAEAGRRLLREQNEDGTIGYSAAALKWSSLAALIIIPSLTFLFYGALGNPDMPDMPLEARMTAPLNNMDFAAAMARMENHLATHPDDSKALTLIAPIYLRLREFDKAAGAFARLIKLGVDDAHTNMGLATALVQLNQGQINSDARKAYEAALRHEPDLYEAEFYIGLAQQQAGDVAQAIATWRHLYTRAPAQAPWLNEVAQNIMSAGGNVPQRAEAPLRDSPAQNPNILTMVERLAQKLEANPRDLLGWLQLIKSYKVLHNDEKLKSSRARAHQIFIDDAAALAEIDQQSQD